MSSDPFFALESASWPLIWLDSSGVIRKINPSATLILGSDLADTRLAALWLPVNAMSFEDFILQMNRHSPSNMDLVLRQKGGGSERFRALICQLKTEDQPGFLLQLVRKDNWASSQLPGLPVSTQENQSESCVLQKQKLDCALQLARSVSLDFN